MSKLLKAKREDKRKRQQFTPYPILQRIKKNKQDKEKKDRDEARILGNYMPDKNKSSVKKTEILKRMIGDRNGIKGVGDGTRGLKFSSVGKYKDGVLYLSKNDIKSVQQPKKLEPPPFLRENKKPASGDKKKKKKNKKKNKKK